MSYENHDTELMSLVHPERFAETNAPKVRRASLLHEVTKIENTTPGLDVEAAGNLRDWNNEER